MSLVEMYHARHKNFHAKIAVRAALVPQHQERVIIIPNTPFGVPKIRDQPPIRAELYYHCMWFFDLIHATAPRTARPISVDRIQQAICNHFGVSRQDLISARRTLPIVRPRQIGYYLSKKLTLKSLPEIGRRFGDRDHTSVLSGIRKIEKLRAGNTELDAGLRSIAASLGGSLA